MSDAWYYVDRDEQVGPVSREQLRKFLLSPRGGKGALVWRNGLSDWKAAREVGELAVVFEGPPPLPRRRGQPAVPAAAPLSTNSAQTPTAKESVAKKALRILGSLVGATIGYVAVIKLGATIIWPAALIGITWFILVKCKVESVAVPMLAVVIGHTGWMMVGYAILFAIGSPNRDSLIDQTLLSLVDVVIVAVLSIWFLWARSRAAAVGVLVYQIVTLGTQVLLGADITIPGLSSQQLMVAQAMHVILRLVGVGLCIYAVAKLTKKPTAAELSEVF